MTDMKEIYLKPKGKIYIGSETPITIGDACEIMGEEALIETINSIIISEDTTDKKIFVITLFTILKEIKIKYPELHISILSEGDVLVEITNDKGKNKFLEKIKIILVCLLLFIGGGIAIMNFHADVNMIQAQKNFYEIITGRKVEKPFWVSIPYSLGIGLGMIVFFNHISPKKRKKEDPSPLDLEIYTYENSVDELILHKSKERKN